MLFIHNFSPILVSLGPVAIRYYSLAYLAGFLFAYFWLRWCSKKGFITISYKDVDDLVLAIAAGTILGGRLGYMLFYNIGSLFSLETFMIWHGGMSFHGGLIGIVIAVLLYTKKSSYSFLQLADIIVIPGALALFFGRIANFINGELVGTPTNVSWCVVFPQVDELCRHPSQLYEALTNAVEVIVLVPLFLHEKLKDGAYFALFLILYGVLRTVITIYRDDIRWLSLGFVSLGTGQVLSLLTAAVGVAVLMWVYRRENK